MHNFRGVQNIFFKNIFSMPQFSDFNEQVPTTGRKLSQKCKWYSFTTWNKIYRWLVCRQIREKRQHFLCHNGTNIWMCTRFAKVVSNICGLKRCMQGQISENSTAHAFSSIRALNCPCSSISIRLYCNRLQWNSKSATLSESTKRHPKQVSKGTHESLPNT